MSGLLGQLAPAAGVWVDLYVVPSNRVVSMRVIVTNRGTTDTTFRVAASKDGAAIADEHHITTDKPIQGNDTGATIGFVVSHQDVVRVFAGNGNLSFTATGETREGTE